MPEIFEAEKRRSQSQKVEQVYECHCSRGGGGGGALATLIEGEHQFSSVAYLRCCR